MQSTHAQHSNRSGYTLIELMIAIVASSFLIVGLSSSIFIATQIVNPTQRTQQILDASEAVRQITDELRYAVYVLDRSSTSVDFVVHDRTGDGQADRIRYEWSGTVGDPLTKILNDSDPQVVIPSVVNFDLTFLINGRNEYFDSPPVESSEQLLTQHVGGGSWSDFRITTSDWVGQYIAPENFNVQILPPDTIRWTVTKAEIGAKYTDPGDNGEAWVRIRPATGDNTPASVILDEAGLKESSLSSGYTTQTLLFSNEVPLAPTDSICLTVEHRANADAADIQYDDDFTNHRVVTDDAGATWNHPPTPDAMRHRLFGKYTQPSNTQESVTRQFLQAATVTLQVGDLDTSVTTEAGFLNRPEVCSAFWEATFDTDPTATDLDFNGTHDWKTRDDSSFVTGSLVNGVFHAYGTELDTAPLHDFDKTTTVNVRMKNTSIGGNGAVFWINADRDGSTAVPIYVSLKLQPDSTQTLCVFWKESNTVSKEVATVEGLTTDFVDVRIVVRPNDDLFAVWVNRQFVGSFDYTPFAIGNDDRWASVFEWGSDAEFEHVRIKVAE